MTSCNMIQAGLQWQTLEFEIQQYKHMGEVVVMGDLNARIGLLNDNIVQDVTPNNVPCSLYCVSESLPRVSQDITVNTYGKQLIDICIIMGLQIVNGWVGADRGIGRYTCYTYDESSVVDNVLAQTSIRERIVRFEVDDLQLHSNHCPVLLKLNTRTSNRSSLEETRKLSEALLKERITSKEVEYQTTRQVRFSDQWEVFQNCLSEVDWRDRMTKLSDDLDTLTLEEGAESLVSALTVVARDLGVICLRNKGSAQNKKSRTSFPNNLWFDQDFKVAKRKVFCNYMAQNFKWLTMQKKRDHNSCLNVRLRALSRKDPNTFGKSLNWEKSRKRH